MVSFITKKTTDDTVIKMVRLCHKRRDHRNEITPRNFGIIHWLPIVAAAQGNEE